MRRRGYDGAVEIKLDVVNLETGEIIDGFEKPVDSIPELSVLVPLFNQATAQPITEEELLRAAAK